MCRGVLTPAWHQAHQRSCVASADSTGVNWPAEYRTAEIEWSDEALWNWRNEIEAVGSAEPGLHMAKISFRHMRASCPWVRVLFRRTADEAAVHIPGMVARAR